MSRFNNMHSRDNEIRNAEDFKPDIAKDVESFAVTKEDLQKYIITLLAIIILATIWYIWFKNVASSDVSDSSSFKSHESQIIKKDFELKGLSSRLDKGHNLSHMNNINPEESPQEQTRSSNYQENQFSNIGKRDVKNEVKQKPIFEKYRSIKIDATTENNALNTNVSQENNSSMNEAVVFAEKTKQPSAIS